MTWAATTGGRLSGFPTFGDLMKQTDAKGRELSFLGDGGGFCGRGRAFRKRISSCQSWATLPARRRFAPLATTSGPNGQRCPPSTSRKWEPRWSEAASMVHVLFECRDVACHGRERADLSADGIARRSRCDSDQSPVAGAADPGSDRCRGKELLVAPVRPGRDLSVVTFSERTRSPNHLSAAIYAGPQAPLPDGEKCRCLQEPGPTPQVRRAACRGQNLESDLRGMES